MNPSPLLRTARDVGREIRAARRREGMTVADLARRSGLSERVVRGIELGAVIADAEHLRSIATAFGVRLFGGTVPASEEAQRREIGELVKVYLAIPPRSREPLRRFLRSLGEAKE